MHVNILVIFYIKYYNDIRKISSMYVPKYKISWGRDLLQINENCIFVFCEDFSSNKEHYVVDFKLM